ncbi:MoaD/ThiS family protein [Persicitalea jodogahamensis]|uniref:Molybdopterin synthase sulfur carrier subunit n=1 Tax=Persicitalea jodogahamensis TaxID=402147 RepID=A0A8J3D4T5_9BACT|nr:MoaD/ThiS family protein [Persicitalea jodogahamensis]GHB73848.1 molybdopterin synthase sulfur carrier subunit [Persicitalea jodogahamensis]
MTLSILYFGMIAEATGQPLETWTSLDALTVGDLKNDILKKYPVLRDRKFQVAVNQQILDDAFPIPPSAEVALLPPFAGG